MGKVHIAVEARIEQTEAYKAAKSLYEQHRLARARIQEFDRPVRAVGGDAPDAVPIAQADAPVRRPQGPTKGDFHGAGIQDGEQGRNPS